jgi:intracellular multiplication protein IcmJ
MGGNQDLQIVLGVGRGAASARQAAEHNSNEAGSAGLTAELKHKVFEHDDHSCRFCGFKSMKYQQVHFKNGIETDMRPENMLTSCIFCHQCFRLDEVGGMRSGVLIWLPEIEQAQLHNMARAVYVARISQGPVADAARSILDVLIKRREGAKERLGTDDPSILSMVMADYISPKSYEARARKLDGIRLFPLDRRIIKESDLEFNQFPQILAYWRSKDGPFGGMQPKNWIELYRDTVMREVA